MDNAGDFRCKPRMKKHYSNRSAHLEAERLGGPDTCFALLAVDF